MKISLTGHRPKILGGYTESVFSRIRETAEKALSILEPSLVYTGMAQGWDMEAAKACEKLKINFVAVIPFHNQEKVWPTHVQKEYHRLLGIAAAVECCSEETYDKRLLFLRNKILIDHLDHSEDSKDVVLALYDGHTQGGTQHAIDYAMKKKCTILNAWGIYQGQTDKLSVLEY